MQYSIHGSSSDWFLHQVVSSIIHSAIYGMAYHIFKHLSAGEAIVAGAVLLLGAWLIYRMFCKNS